MRKPYAKSAITPIKDAYFTSPTMRIGLRPLARAAGISPPAAKRSADYLISQNFLEKRSEGYSALHEERGFREEKRLWNLARLQQSGVIENIARQTAPDAIILFGSYGRGEDWERSDIDLALIGGKTASLKLETFEKALGREVKIHRLNRPSREFLNTLVNGIVVYGRWDPL